MKCRQLSGLVSAVETWNPNKCDPEDCFQYIDLSAIDQETKSIVGARQIKCGDAPSRARQLVRAGDILVSTVRPNLNGVAKVPEGLDGATASTGFCVLRPNPELLDGNFLFQWIKSTTFVSEMVRQATGASYPAVSDRIVLASSIPLPSVPEQRRIAAILDHADALRAKRREALAQLDSLTQSIFIEMFGDPIRNPMGWPVAKLPEVIYFQEGPGVRNWQFRNEGVKLINVGNIVDGSLVLSNTNRFLAADEVSTRYKHFLLDAGDWVVASSGVTWGKIAMVAQEHLPLCLNTSVIRLRPLDSRIAPLYIRAFVESKSFKVQIARLITGSAQPNFGPAHLKQVNLLLPPISLQDVFSNRLKEIERLKEVYRRSASEQENLILSLQHRAFRGAL